MFMKFGIRSVTMDQISGHLGISKRTLYETFKDKNELLREGLEYFSNIKRNEAKETFKKSDNVIETIYILARKGEEMKHQINPMFFEDIRKYFLEIHYLMTTEGRYRDYSLTLELLNKGVNEGLFSKGLDIELVNNFIHQIMNIVVNDGWRCVIIGYIYIDSNRIVCNSVVLNCGSFSAWVKTRTQYDGDAASIIGYQISFN